MAYTLLTRPNQVETAVQSLHFWLSVWTLSCRCPVKAFHFYVVSALQFIVFVFYFWLIRAVSSSYVHQQHFRPRSLAFICHFQFYLDRRSFQIRYAVHFHCFHMVLSMFAVLFSHGFVHVFSVRIVLAILTSLIATTT